MNKSIIRRWWFSLAMLTLPGGVKASIVKGLKQTDHPDREKVSETFDKAKEISREMVEEEISSHKKRLEEKKEAINNEIKRLEEEAEAKKRQEADWYQAKITELKDGIKNKLERLSPKIPIGGSGSLVSLDIAERKARLKAKLKELDSQILLLPHGSIGRKISVYFLLTIEVLANFNLVTLMMGSDWLAGNEFYSTLASGVVALLLTVAAIVAFDVILSSLPVNEWTRNWIVRPLKIAGGVFLITGIIMLGLMRGELLQQQIFQTEETFLIE